MHGFSIYRAYKLATSSAAPQAFDIGKITAIALGVVFIVLGNFMPKTRSNSTIGARTKWSMYNDNTWRKSNRFGAVALMVAGVLTIVTAVFVKSSVGEVLAAVVYIILAAVITTVYSHRVYVQELAAETKADAR